MPDVHPVTPVHGLIPGIDRWRAGLKSPLGCRLADAMVAQAIHQWILVVNPMWLWRRIRCEGTRACNTRGCNHVSRGRGKVPAHTGSGRSRRSGCFGRSSASFRTWPFRLSTSPRLRYVVYIQCIVVNLKSIDASPIPGAYVDFSASFFGTAIHQCGLRAIEPHKCCSGRSS